MAAVKTASNIERGDTIAQDATEDGMAITTTSAGQNPCPCAFTGILIRKVNYLPSINSARYTHRIILLQTVKSGWSALLSANCSPFRPLISTALCHLPIMQQSALPSADNNIEYHSVENSTQKSFNSKR